MAIFVHSPALEVFRISIAHRSKLEISLDELLSQGWTSTKLKELKLCLRLDEEQEVPYRAEIFFSDPMPRWTIGLERLYRQIGHLTDLRILDLRVAMEKNIWDSYDEEKIFATATMKSVQRTKTRRLLGC